MASPALQGISVESGIGLLWWRLRGSGGKSATALHRGYCAGSGVSSFSSVFIGAGSVANNVLRAGKGVGFRYWAAIERQVGSERVLFKSMAWALPSSTI